MNIAKAMLHLEDLGVKKVIVQYSGGGDSGQIDEIYFSKSGEDDDENNGEKAGVSAEVIEIIEAKSYRLLDPIEDWYNNEGGYGTIIINVPSGDYKIENNVYVREIETFDHDGTLEDDQ